MTVGRYLAVHYPFGELRFNTWTTTDVGSEAWLFGISLASLPLLPFAQNWFEYSNSSMCLGLPVTSEQLPVWQYFTSLLLHFIFCSFCSSNLHRARYARKLKETSKRTRRNLNPQRQLHQDLRMQEIAIAKLLSFAVIIYFICWFHIISLGLVTLAGLDIGEADYRWLAVTVLPSNSTLNLWLSPCQPSRRR